ncbi:MAG TPA: DUF885 domain-containing protein [candidate division Zixibacteria bacterium]|nr:DUF885 domain-containing protein [candidate division Zixibacteria bacterium]
MLPTDRQSPPSDADARFDRTVDRWFRQLLELDPLEATYIGIHDHDHRLAGGDREEIEALAAFHRATITEMERFDPSELTPDRALDRDLVIHESRLAHHQLTERRQWAGSTRGAEHIGDALFPLFTRDFAPAEVRLASIAARLEDAPRHLAATRTRLDAPVRIWLEIDLEATERLPEFLDAILAAAQAEHVDAAVVDRLRTAVDGARRALAEHADWLRHEALPRAEADWRAGRDGLEELIRLRALAADGDEIVAVGEEILAAETAARDAVATEIDPLLDPREVADLVKNDHPATFPEALEAYRESIARARAFVVEHELATMPPRDELRVIETPVHQRHLIPFAAYYIPPRFDPDPVGIYIVTPPSEPSMWREHNYASISNTSVHEAYPGHHLQLAAAITNPSLVRCLNLSAAEFVEGWAFYCERMMKEAGFDATPAHRYIQHTDAIWRAVRIILDIRLHRGDISFEEAVDFLVEKTGLERPGALAEVRRYTSTPTYQLSYLYGRHMFDRLRERVERRLGPAFSLRRFHDTLLYGGTMPISLAERLFDVVPQAMDR